MVSTVRVFCVDALRSGVVVQAARVFGMGGLLMNFKEVETPAGVEAMFMGRGVRRRGSAIIHTTMNV